MFLLADKVDHADVPGLEDAISPPHTSRPALSIIDLPPELLEKIFTYLHPGNKINVSFNFGSQQKSVLEGDEN